MGWECPACTFLNRHEDYLQCDCCGSERPSPPKARRHPAPGQQRRRQQQAPADPHTSIVEIDLLSSEDEEEAAEQQQQQQQQQPQPQQQQAQRQQQQAQQPDQQQEQRSLGSMGAGGSKSSGGVAVARSPLGTSPRGWGEDTWDDDFQIQLSESLATTIRQLQQPGTASVHKQARWAEAEAAAEAVAAAAEAEVAAKAAAAEAGKQQQQAQEQQVAAGGNARVDIDLTGEEWQEPLVQQPKKKKARRANEAAGAAGGRQQQQQQAKQQPGSRQPAEQGSGSSAHTAVLDAGAAAAGPPSAAAGAAAMAAAAAPPSKKPRLASTVQAGAAGASDEGQTAGWAMRALRVAARYASRQATSGKQQAAAEEPSPRQQQQQQQQLSDALGRQELALQSCRHVSKRPWSTTLRQLPSMHLSSPDAQQAQAGPLPVNPSLRLPPRRHSPGGTSPDSGSPGMSPPLGSSPESVQRLPDAVAVVETLQRQEQQEQEEAAEEEEQQQQQQGGSGRRVAWQQCVAALYDPAPLPAQQAQQAVQQMPLPPAAPVPAWVQRARQGPDVTQALVAAAADCPHVPLPNTWRQQRQQECEPAPVPGWLAYRVAGVLPESAGCRHAADVLRVGAAAAAAAAAADAEADGSEERQQADAQPAGNGSQQQQLDLSQLAARLVAGLTMQEEPYADLDDRSMHLFSHRNSALHRKLKRHLAPLLGGSTAGGSRRPRIPGGRQPSRLRLPGTGDAAAGDAGEGAAAAAGAASEAAAAAAAAAQPFTGVRTTAEGRFTACLYVRNEQLWLGSYAEVEAAARAVDLAMVYRWLCNGRPADRPAFNLPHNRYLEDADLLQELALMPGADALKAHIKRVCGAAPPNWWQR